MLQFPPFLNSINLVKYKLHVYCYRYCILEYPRENRLGDGAQP